MIPIPVHQALPVHSQLIPMTSLNEIKTKVEDNKTKIDEMLSLFLYEHNVPFNAIESASFKSFLQFLQSDYTPPNREEFAGPLLRSAYKNITVNDMKSLKIGSMNEFDKNVVMLVVGCLDPKLNTKSFVTMLHCSDGHYVFLETFEIVDFDENHEEFIAAVKTSVELAKSRYNVDVYVVVGDDITKNGTMQWIDI